MQQARAWWLAMLVLQLLLASTPARVATTQCENGPCGPGNEKCLGTQPQQYVFHLSDLHCGINDVSDDGCVVLHPPPTPPPNLTLSAEPM
jgi:hypothetical protein